MRMQGEAARALLVAGQVQMQARQPMQALPYLLAAHQHASRLEHRPLVQSLPELCPGFLHLFRLLWLFSTLLCCASSQLLIMLLNLDLHGACGLDAGLWYAMPVGLRQHLQPEALYRLPWITTAALVSQQHTSTKRLHARHGCDSHSHACIQALEAAIAVQEAKLAACPLSREEVAEQLQQLLPTALAAGSLALQGKLHLVLAKCLLTGLPPAGIADTAPRCVLWSRG